MNKIEEYKKEKDGLDILSDIPRYACCRDIAACKIRGIEKKSNGTGGFRGSIASEPGLPALEQFEALAQGKVKAIWILCTNPAASLPDIDMIEKALRQAELVVVQDAYHPTATSRFAHVILPAAQWSEKEGVMTNSERRFTYMPKLVEPPGEALPDWKIISLFAYAMGFGAKFMYQSAADIFAEFAALTSRDGVRSFGREPCAASTRRAAAMALSEIPAWRNNTALRRCAISDR